MGSQGADSAEGVPHVVAVPFIWPGHTTPLLHLCRYLASSGCLVTFLKVGDQSDDRRKECWDNGVRVVSAIPLDPAKAPPAVHREDDSHTEEVESYFHRFEGLSKGEMLPIFQEISSQRGAPVTCVISDVYVGWAQEIAAELKAKWIALWTSTVAELVIYFHMPRLIENQIFPFGGPPSDKPISCIPGLPELHPNDYPMFGYIPDKSLHRVLHRFKEMVQKISQADRVLVNSMYKLETGPIESLRDSNVNVQPVGPLHLLSERVTKVEDPDCVLQWLDTKRNSSVIYIAFGTTMSMAAGQLEELAWALEDSRQEFVWAIRKSVMRLLPEGFQERMEGRNQGMVVLWAPQVAVLKHPAVGAFFTHCGWNSVLESISTGMPMIARPLSGDQVLTRRFVVEEWGIGMGLKGGKLGITDVADREEIKSVINALMRGNEGELVKERALQVKDMVEKATGSGGSSSRNLGELVHHLYKP